MVISDKSPLMLFQFTHPGRGATAGANQAVNAYLQFQFTHPGRGATSLALKLLTPTAVSIHAPREGCDSNCYTNCYTKSVSIHAPREGCDQIVAIPSLVISPFQFTHPGRGATGAPRYCSEGQEWFQFTHPGRGATPEGMMSWRVSFLFQFTHPGRGATMTPKRSRPGTRVSIHAPREGCDG